MAKIAKMTPIDLLTLKMVFTEPLKKTEHSFSFLKFVIFVDLERKNKFHDNHATHVIWPMSRIDVSLMKAKT